MVIGLIIGWTYFRLQNNFGKSLVILKDPSFQLDLKYASTDNFLKKNIYQEFHLGECWVLPELQSKIKNIIPRLKELKLKLILWDCYRPLKVQEVMWKLVPDPRYVADPKVGSNHNRGAAIDVALSDESGKLLAFPTQFDDFSPKASPKYQCPSQDESSCRNRDKLIELMTTVGLEVFPTEWWHFQLPEAHTLPLIQAVPKEQK
jgi:D-alanyl-D-alanine dipeptidase